MTTETQLVRVESRLDVGALLQHAITEKASPENMSQLYALAREMKADSAREAFNLAMQKFQETCPPIVKDRTADTGKYKYRYATLEEIAGVIRKPLADVGLSYSFDCELLSNQITSTCRIRHIDGHSETSKFTAPIDGNAAMNAMQKTASATSYANRYALRNALGLTIAEEDDDGRAVTPTQAPEPRQGGPVAVERAKRVEKQELLDLHTYWKETMDAYGRDQGGEAFRAFIVEHGGPSEKPTEASRWTREQLISVGRAVDDLRGEG